jgi:hypothetical protein
VTSSDEDGDACGGHEPEDPSTRREPTLPPVRIQADLLPDQSAARLLDESKVPNTNEDVPDEGGEGESLLCLVDTLRKCCTGKFLIVPL